MDNSRKGLARYAMAGVVVLSMGYCMSAAQALTAQFFLQPAGAFDTVLDINNPADQTLNIELWVSLSDGPLPGGALAYSFYLEPSVSGVISYTVGSFANVLPMGYPMVQGVDNLPRTGGFSRGPGTYPPVSMSLGQTKLATFSISALSEGVATYNFTQSTPNRPWGMDFEDMNAPMGFTSATVTQAQPGLTITVIPEPATGVAVLLLFTAFVSRRSSRR